MVYHRHEADTAPAFGLPFVHGIIGPQASSVGARKIVCRWREYDGNALLPRTLKIPDWSDFWQVVSVPPGGEHSKFVLQLTNIHALSEVASLGSNSCHQFAVCMVKLGGDYLVTALLSFHYHPTAYMSIPSSAHALDTLGRW